MQYSIAALIFFLLLITNNFAFLLVYFGIVLIVFLTRSKIFGSNKGSYNNTQELEAQQLQAFAGIFGWLLAITHQNDDKTISQAKASIINFATIYDTLTVDEIHKYSESFDQSISNPNDIGLTQMMMLARSTFVGVSKFNATTFFQSLIALYRFVTPTIPPNLFSVLLTIGINLGITGQFALMEIVKAGIPSPNGEFDGFGQSGFEHTGRSHQDGFHYSQVSESQIKLEEAYKLLGCNSNVSKQDLRRIKRDLLIKYHPDKAPEGKKDEYNDLSQKINAAVDLISETRGWN